MKLLTIALAALAVAGCTSSNNDNDFLCGAQDGQPCQTMSQVDQKLAYNRKFSSQVTPNISRTTSAVAVAPASQKPLAVASTSKPKATQTRVAAAPSNGRVPEQTGRMWIAPYNDGAYVHEGGLVRFVVRNARWAN